MVYYCIAFSAVLLASLGQIILKLGALGPITRPEASFEFFNHFFSLLFTPKIIVGLSFYILGALLWILVLSNLQLSKAYPILGLSYVIVLSCSVLFLGENLTIHKSVGTALIVFGIVIVGFSK